MQIRENMNIKARNSGHACYAGGRNSRALDNRTDVEAASEKDSRLKRRDADWKTHSPLLCTTLMQWRAIPHLRSPIKNKHPAG